jgi:hypothetical protein
MANALHNVIKYCRSKHSPESARLLKAEHVYPQFLHYLIACETNQAKDKTKSESEDYESEREVCHRFALAADGDLLHAEDFERPRRGGECTGRGSNGSKSRTKNTHERMLYTRTSAKPADFKRHLPSARPPDPPLGRGHGTGSRSPRKLKKMYENSVSILKTPFPAKTLFRFLLGNMHELQTNIGSRVLKGSLRCGK